MSKAKELAIKAAGHLCANCSAEDRAFHSGYIQGFAAGYVNNQIPIPTADELRDTRAKLEMSQAKFASFLRVGIATLKRWESGAKMNRSNAELIRLKLGDLGE